MNKNIMHTKQKSTHNIIKDFLLQCIYKCKKELNVFNYFFYIHTDEVLQNAKCFFDKNIIQLTELRTFPILIYLTIRIYLSYRRFLFFRKRKKIEKS